MKILKIIFISFIILIIVGVAAAVIFVKTFDVNRFKPQIIGGVSKALNRQVDFERAKLGISLRQGISLKITDFSITDDPAFRKGDFLTVKDVSLGVDVLGYIFRKEVNVPNILIESANITIIRQKDGTLNVQSLTKSTQVDNKKDKATPVSVTAAVPALLISSLKVTNSILTFIDHSFEPALTLDVSNLNLSVSKISLTKSFPFVVEAAVLSAKKNIRIEGKARINPKTNELIFSDLKGATDLSSLLIEKIPTTFPMVKEAILPASIKGKVDFALGELTTGTSGLLDLSVDVTLTNGSLQLKELALPVKDIGMDVKITRDQILVDKLSAGIGQGSLQASGSIQDYLKRQDYNLTAGAENLNIQELINQDKSAIKTEGIASLNMRLKGEGFSQQALVSNLSGEANITVVKAKLKNINVLRAVLDKISVISGLAEKFEASLPERFKQKLTQTDTALSDIKLPITIENGQLILKDTVFGADEFQFKGQGQARFDGVFSLEGSFLIPQDLSQAMVSVVDELQYLLDDNQQIYIPLKISGKGADFKFSVDVEYIAKKLLTSEAKKQIFKAIDKALGTEEPQAQGQDSQQPGSEEKSTIKEKVGDILRDILE